VRKNKKRKKMKTKILSSMLMVIGILMMVTVSAAESTPMPFGISGYVFFANGSACNNSSVTITNLNTGETFSTITLSSSNYYRAKPMPALDDIGEGDMLRFNVTAGLESVVVDHRITASETAQGLHRNVTFGEDKIVAEPSPATATPALTPSMPVSEKEEKEEERRIPGFEALPAVIALTLFLFRKKKNCAN